MRIVAWLRRTPQGWRRFGVAVAASLTVDLLWTFLWFPSRVQDRILPWDQLPPSGVPVIVLGAGVLPDREPSRVLQGCLEQALRLQQAGKARWFLVSGDNRSPYYNEPLAMRRWLQRAGVPPAFIVSDYAGRRTYDSLKRAQAIFGVRRAVVVTSDFHLPRAVFIAQHLGLEVRGVAADTERNGFWARLSFWSREWAARHKALFDTWFPPDTLLGPREPTPDDWAPPLREGAGDAANAQKDS